METDPTFRITNKNASLLIIDCTSLQIQKLNWLWLIWIHLIKQNYFLFFFGQVIFPTYLYWLLVNFFKFALEAHSELSELTTTFLSSFTHKRPVTYLKRKKCVAT